MYLLIDNDVKINRSDIYSYNLTKNATPSSALALGGCCISAFTISFDKRNYGKFNKNSKVEVFNDKNNKMGEFFIDTPNNSNHIMTLECSDILKRASVKWKGRSFPCSVYEVFTNILVQIGISSTITIDDLPCGHCVVNESKNLKNMTCIDLLSDIAELNGGFFFVDNYGELKFKSFNFDDQKEYDEKYIHEVSKIEEVLTTRRGLYIVGSNNQEYVFGDTYNQLVINDNEIIKTMTNDGINLVGNTILNKIKHFEYYAAEVSLWQDDKPIELGDVIKVIDLDGDYHSIIVHEISFSNDDNYCNIESYGDDLKTKATEETSQIENDTTTTYDSGEVYMGRGQNHQRVLAKAGTYVLAEELVEDVSSFSKVFLNLFLDFNYDYVENRILFFDIYANNKKVKSLKCKTDQGFNQFSVGFLADVDLESNTNLYSCRVTLLENETIEILEFECQLSFIVKSCKIRDAIATDQKYIEKYEKIDNTIFNQNRFTIKDLRENITIKFPIYTLDVSIDDDESVIAEYYEDGSVEVSGNGQTKNTKITEIAGFKLGTDAKNAFMQANRVSISGDVILGTNFFYGCVDIEEARFSGEIYVGDRCFEGSKLTTLIGEENILTVGNSAFRDCNLVGTFNFTNCISFDDYSFYNNPEMNYIKLRIPLAKFNDVGMEHCFENCLKLDGIVVLNRGTAYDYQVHKTAFKNAFFSTFMLMSDVNYSTLSYLQDLTCTNPVLYVCEETWESRYLDKLMDLQNNYGFTVMFYVKSQEEEILNKLYEENSRYYEG